MYFQLCSIIELFNCVSRGKTLFFSDTIPINCVSNFCNLRLMELRIHLNLINKNPLLQTLKRPMTSLPILKLVGEKIYDYIK